MCPMVIWAAMRFTATCPDRANAAGAAREALA
jgi:hypothetical protein